MPVRVSQVCYGHLALGYPRFPLPLTIYWQASFDCVIHPSINILLLRKKVLPAPCEVD